MKQFKILLLSTLCLLTLGLASAAESTDPATPVSLDGDWKVLLENANSRKVIRFRIAEKDQRLRGKVAAKETGTQDLDGRREDDGKILFWTTMTLQGGQTIESNFKGTMENEDKIVGSCRFFDKNYTFSAERVKKDDK